VCLLLHHTRDQIYVRHSQAFSDLIQEQAEEERRQGAPRGAHPAEQLRLCRPQRIVATAVLRTDTGGLEPPEEDAPKRMLWGKKQWRGSV